MKESLYNHDNGVIFRETFNSEQDSIKNGGTPTDVTFSSGVATFNGSSSKINYGKDNKFNFSDNIFSIAGKITTGSDITNIQAVITTKDIGSSENGFEFRIFSGNLEFGINNGAASNVAQKSISTNQTLHFVCVSDGTNNNIYIDSVAGTSKVIAGNGGQSDDFIVASDSGGGQFGEFSLEYFEIYNRALTANEVALLYEGNLYREPVFTNEVLSIDSRNGGIYDKLGNTLTNTGVSIVRDGGVYSQRYNGDISKLDCGSDLIGTGDKTFIIWFKAFSDGELGQGRLLSNGKLELFFTTTGFKLRSDGVTTSQISNVWVPNVWNNLIITRSSDGTCAYYSNGVLQTTGLSSDSGVPEAGTTNLIVGNNNAGIVCHDGNIAIVKAVPSILTTKQIENYYHATKNSFE
jgi:hypothetical protein